MMSKICPKCGSSDISMIIYGYVENPPTIEEQRKEKITLGGCVTDESSTKWECDDCLYRWGTLD